MAVTLSNNIAESTNISKFFCKLCGNKETGFREVNEEFKSDQFGPEDEIPLSKRTQICIPMQELGSNDVKEFTNIDANLHAEDDNRCNILSNNVENES
ncbi:hypothetical protein Trydic_g2541 [Trypoxylus dichotomus]